MHLLLLTLGALFLSPSLAAADRLSVTASIFPLYEFAREVAGSEADVEFLLPPGASPHTWEPLPSDLLMLSRADLFLYVSREMEPWADDLLRAVGKKGLRVVQMQKTLGIPEDDAKKDVVDSVDPHFWLDFSLAARAVQTIGETMAALDPAAAPGFTARAGEYSRSLLDLDRRYAAGLARCRSRTFVTGGHSAFGFLAQRYGLVQIPLYGMSPDSEPAPAYLASVVKRMKEEGIKVVFLEEMASPRLAAVLASEAGASTMVLATAGNITPKRKARGTTFLDIMEENLSTLREGLSCE